jgi:uncharacterized phage protein (TIGR02218 family)
MTWLTQEKSQRGSQPVELYKFEGPGTFQYRYARHTEPVTHDAEIYTPVPTASSAPLSGSSENAGELTVRGLPDSLDVVRDYAFGTPPRALYMTLLRVQADGAVEALWRGPVVGWRVTGDTASCRVPSLLATVLDVQVPGIAFDSQCHHFLGDELCGFEFNTGDGTLVETTVSGGSGWTVNVNSVGGADDQWFRGGEILRLSDGESRTITDQVGTALKLSYPFRTLGAGNSVELRAGCGRTQEICKTKFNNLARYLGFPYIARYNPWKGPRGFLGMGEE